MKKNRRPADRSKNARSKSRLSKLRNREPKARRPIYSLGLISVLLMTQVIVQFLFQAILANQFGATASIDAFSAALTIPTVVSTVLVGSLGFVLVPQLVPLIKQDEKEIDFWQAASALGNWVIIISALASVIVYLLADPLCRWLYRGFPQGTLEQTIVLLEYLAPTICLSGILAWLQAVYHSQQKFLWAAFASAAGPAITTYLAYDNPIRSTGIVAFSLVIGGLVAVLIQWIPIASNLRWSYIPHPILRRSWNALWPLLLLAAYTRLDPIIDRILAAGLDEGSVARLNYAQRFIVALVMVSVSGLSTIAFPTMASLANSSDREPLRKHIVESLRRMALIVIPVSLGATFFAQDAVGDLLERGEFTAIDTIEVSRLFAELLPFFVAASIGEILGKAFYSIGNTRTPALISVLGFTIGIGLKFWWVALWGVHGLTWASSAYYAFNVLIMFLLLQKEVNLLGELGKSVGSIGRMLIATAAALGGAYLGQRTELPGSTWISLPVAAAAYAFSLWVMAEPTFMELFRSVRRSNLRTQAERAPR